MSLIAGPPSHQCGAPPNKALHQTRRGGVAHFVRRGPVVEARLAGEGWCWTDRGTDRSAFVPQPPGVAEAPPVLLLGNGPAWAALVRSLHQSRPSLGARPSILQHPVGQVSTWPLPSASSWLGANDQATNSGFPVVTSRRGAARPSNKGLERTRRVGVPAARAIIRVSPRRSSRCSAGTGEA
jgi:hypothetical protein